MAWNFSYTLVYCNLIYDFVGIMYVLYDKISSAALALQDMNGKSLPGKTEKIKVRIYHIKFVLLFSLELIRRASMSQYFDNLIGTHFFDL